MRDHLILILVLLGHVIGDFYAQTDTMAENKDERFGILLLHCAAYALCMGLVLGIGIPRSKQLLFVAGLLCIAHFLIDLLKHLFWRSARPGAYPRIQKHMFILDQCVHLLSLAAISWVWGSQLTSTPFLSQGFTQLPAPPVILLLGLLCVLKPVGMLFEKGRILEHFKPGSTEGKGNEPEKNAGKIIGYLERIIVFFFLLYKQYTAIAFVLTAKSIARFDMDKSKAEYYLIGTLLSVASAFVISFLLGLCG